MNEDTPPAAAANDDEETREDGFDAHDDAVLAADATGMLAGERLITEAVIEEALETGEQR